MKLEALIEAVLFAHGAPMSMTELANLFDEEVENVRLAVDILEGRLADRGLRLQRNEEEVTLVTAPEASPPIQSLAKRELSKELGKASVETLAIILYRGPVAKNRIDYIRGVNSTFILRSLAVRGLVERVSNPKEARSFLYRPTSALLSHLGVTKLEDLPDYEIIEEKIKEVLPEDSPLLEAAPEDDYVAGLHEEDW